MTNPPSRRKRSNHERRVAAAASYPPSVVLDFAGRHEDDSGSVAEAKTMASARTTAGDPIRVSFCFAAPPEVSFLVVGFPGVPEEKHVWPEVMAAHGDSVLFQISVGEQTDDHFVYNTGVADGPNPRPPMLSLLPPYYLTEKEIARGYYPNRRPTDPVRRSLEPNATGLARRGEDEFVVAELQKVYLRDEDDKPWGKLLRLRSGEWRVERPTIVSHGRNGKKPKLDYWEANNVLALHNGLLCWVDISRGLLFCNVFHETPELWHVPLPVKCGDVYVTGSGSTVKCVDISPRCCCGGKGATKCRRSRHAYTVKTWMLRMEDMVWVMDAMVDSTEIWALDGYKDLPRVPLECPVVSLDDPHIIYFEVCEIYAKKKGDPTLWLIMLDLRSKALLSACCCPNHNSGYGRSIERYVISTRISDYFNLYPSSNGSSSMSKSHLNFVAPLAKKLRANNDERSGKSFCQTHVIAPIKVSEILKVLQEIPNYGLAHGDMLKVISILSHDNGGRFKSLLNLPMSLRKNWLLMEIKASDA